MQDKTDCLKLGKTTNQYKHFCSSISPAASTSGLNERDYSDIELSDWESSDNENEIAELNFESQNLDFCRDHSVAHKSFRTKTKDEPIRKKTISFELFPHVDTSDLIQTLNDSASEADFYLQTLIEEQLNDPVLHVVRKRIKTSDTRPQKTPDINQSKGPYHITTSLSSSSSNRTQTSYATENQFRTLAKPRWKSVYFHRFPYHSFFSPYS